ncbi:MAG: allophanate hydrolase [Verrucomicrobiales bacterium]|nr:allophanate hydrolase [Verrucomicrobiales bacterium]
MSLDLSIPALHAKYASGELTPATLVGDLKAAISASDPLIWISLTSDLRMDEILQALEGESPQTKPLFGIPFAIKDNIDLAGNPTTAACPDYSFDPDKDATVVALLIEAGAIPLGKTNLDQFATGLVGVRSPYGFPKNPFNEDYIPGGSSSGSAVAVARDLVTFSLGTDTAGSGRIPAGLNELVGLKPTFGSLSCNGVVPACRSLDCVSIFAKSPNDAATVFSVAAQPDSDDAYSREKAQSNWFPADRFTFGVPQAEQLQFFGDAEAEKLFEEACSKLESIGGTRVTVDFNAFLEAALLLYEGPWVSERFAAIEDFITTQPDSLHPVTRQIISGGGEPRAVDGFRAQYRLKALKQRADLIMDSVDLIVTPTAGTAYTAAEVAADPIQLNSNLGYYTNFMNLLDLSACAIPAGRLASRKMPWGITLVAPALSDVALLNLANRFNDAAALEPVFPNDWIELVVCGAHMRDLPLNHQLTDRGACFLREDRTAPDYQLLALPAEHGLPPRPGLIRKGSNQGTSIAVECWAIPANQFGSFVAGIPGPLGFGKLTLADGKIVTGFICESAVPEGTSDISALGGWRAFLEASS